MQPGTRLGQYEILSTLGKGGMGEVWNARDTKLGREVAIKTLPEEFARDPDRLARFEREAKLLASLNHPNIGAIHGLEEHEGTRFLVLELIEGDTLADRIRRGPVPVEESLKLALQIAEAVEAAHEKGIIHRDLKPANIKVTSNNKVKVLDFGLAKAFEPSSTESGLSNSPTLSMAATQQGIILGTAAYMSPEQARGDAVDKRADVWAFGCILFEMLTGQQAFDGPSVSDVLAGVLRAEPDWRRLSPSLHPRIRVLLERCLEKDARNRYHDIADARIEVQKALAEPNAGLASAPAARVPSRRIHLVWTVAVLLALLVGGLGGWRLNESEPGIVTRFEFALPEGQRYRNTGRPVIAVSADGSRFVYNTASGIYMREMGELESRLIPGTETGLTSPFLSPDGQWLGYFDGQSTRLVKMPINGGTPVPLVAEAVSNPFGVSWEANGTVVYGQPDGIWQVSENGGEARQIVATKEGEQVYGPQLLPGGDQVLYTLTDATGEKRWDQARIMVASVESGEAHAVGNGSDARYLPTGHLVYATGDSLFGIRFDLKSLSVRGGPVPLVPGLERATRPGINTGSANFGVSDNGSLVYVPAGAAQSDRRMLARVDREGRITALNAPPKAYVDPRVSPDGTRVAVQSLEAEGGATLWVYDLSDDRAIQQLTFEGNNYRPVWTGDSRRITFSSDRDGTMSIYWIPADGSGVAERLTTAAEGEQHWASSWSPDGQTLVFMVERMQDTDWDVWTVSPGSEPEKLYDRPDTVYIGAQFAPRGQWIAYASGPSSGQADIYVEPFPPDGSRRRITQGGGRGVWPVWAPTGRELFYRPTTGSRLPIALKMVEILMEPDFSFRNERTLPINGFATVSYYREFDIMPNRREFLITFPAENSASAKSAGPSVRVVLNWVEELKKRVPVP